MNNMMDSEHASAIATVGQNQIQETALESKESLEGLRNDFSKGEGGAKTGKASYDVLAEGYKIGTMGGKAYAAEKVTKFASGVDKAKAAGSAVYSAGSSTVDAAKSVGRAVEEGVNYSTSYLLPQLKANSGVVGKYKPLYPNAPEPPDPPAAAAAAPADAAADAGSATERLATDVTEGVKSFGEKVGMLGKAAGLAGGLFAAGDDAIHGFKLQGDNAWERTGNALTIAGTVADFIPGLELVGLGLNAWAAADEFKGESDASANQQTVNDGTHKDLTGAPAPVHTWSQMGLVSSLAPDAIHQQVGNVHF
jgi:hypothetical protein